jgi:hypothetical protein
MPTLSDKTLGIATSSNEFARDVSGMIVGGAETGGPPDGAEALGRDGVAGRTIGGGGGVGAAGT